MKKLVFLIFILILLITNVYAFSFTDKISSFSIKDVLTSFSVIDFFNRLFGIEEGVVGINIESDSKIEPTETPIVNQPIQDSNVIEQPVTSPQQIEEPVEDSSGVINIITQEPIVITQEDNINQAVPVPILNGYLSVATLKQSYSINEVINLTDPPNEEKGFFSKLIESIKGIFSKKRVADKVFQPTATKEMSSEISLTGALEVVAFDGEIPTYKYFLISNGQKHQIYPTKPLNFISGTFVNIKGRLVNENLIVDSMNVVGPVETDRLDTLGEQRTAVILVKFNDSSSMPPFSVQQINNSIFNGPVQKFLRENSFNKTWLTGNTYGWYTINYSCGEGGGLVETEEAINLADPDIYFLDIDRIIIITDAFCISGPMGYGTVGKINLESDDGIFIASYSQIRNSVYFYEPTQLPSGGERNDNLTSGLGLILHEFGHNLEAWHANNLDCGTEILYGGCSYGNYGNFYDVMGRGWITGTSLGYGGTNFENNVNAAFHFNALMKEKFNWIQGNRILNITQNGTYVLKPLEKSQAIVAKIWRQDYPQITPYYLEYRIPFGFDESLNDPQSQGNFGGIFINKQEIYDNFTLIQQTRLLDMSPTTYDNYDEDWYNVSLLPQHVFFNEVEGIKITNMEENLSDPNDPQVIFSVEFYEPQIPLCECITNDDCGAGYYCESTWVTCNSPPGSEFNGLCIEISQPTYLLTANPTSGMVPLTVSFLVEGVFPEGIQFVWYFGDSTETTTTNTIQHTYQNSGIYDAFVQILENGEIIGVSNNVSINVLSNVSILPKSKIQNTGSNIIQGYLLMKIQKNNNGAWQDYNIIVNDLSTGTLRTINGNSYLALDEIWNVNNVVINLVGNYRVYSALLNSNGNVIQTQQGSLEDSYEFIITLSTQPINQSQQGIN